MSKLCTCMTKTPELQYHDPTCAYRLDVERYLRGNGSVMRLRIALQVVLDQIDYTQGACTPDEMVGACMPKEVLEMAHEVLESTKDE